MIMGPDASKLESVIACQGRRHLLATGSSDLELLLQATARLICYFRLQQESSNGTNKNMDLHHLTMRRVYWLKRLA